MQLAPSRGLKLLPVAIIDIHKIGYIPFLSRGLKHKIAKNDLIILLR